MGPHSPESRRESEMVKEKCSSWPGRTSIERKRVERTVKIGKEEGSEDEKGTYGIEGNLNNVGSSIFVLYQLFSSICQAFRG